jgi:hypothetical protein
MKFTSKTDLEAPVAFVFEGLADHTAWERDAQRRGIRVERPAGTPDAGLGASWLVKAPFRGKTRNVALTIDKLTPNETLGVAIDGQSVEGEAVLTLIALSQTTTRIRMTLEIRPKTLAARLFLNTLRLAKARVQNRFDDRLTQVGQRIQDQYDRSKLGAAKS